jgi:hypothetical protein
MLALRLARFEHLVDIGRINELRGPGKLQLTFRRREGE